MNESVLQVLVWIAAIASLSLSSLAALMFIANLPLFVRWRSEEDQTSENETARASRSVSVLIPARDEAAGIAASVQAALASADVSVEVIVRDDGSTDGTGEIVSQLASRDPRVRLLRGGDLPPGWNGKQYSCHELAKVATHELILFLDADVRLTSGAISSLTARIDQELSGRQVALLSAFPHQQTGTILEKMLIPMMHQILLCYLPFNRMRASASSAYAAGCGQLFLTRKEDYFRSGTHAAIRGSRHDGLKLPMVYRQAGMLTDCIDGTDLAECRMYTSAPQVIRGLLKNASEGIANIKLIFPFSILLGGANVLPWITAAVAILFGESMGFSGPWNIPAVLCLVAIVLSYLPRMIAASVLRQSWIGAVLHPFAVAVFLLLQWVALFNHARGHQVAWRGRKEISAVKAA